MSFKKHSTPGDGFPYSRIGPLLISRMAEGASYMVVFPYINEQIAYTGMDPSRIGFWSGLVESSYMMTEGIFCPLWSYMADRYGRRVTMLIGLAIRGSTCIGYGFSRNLGGILLMRVVTGVGGGIGAVNRTILGEICGSRYVVKGFSMLTPAVHLGVGIGAYLGGNLARPAERIPFFASYAFLQAYPYLLPNLCIGGLTIFAFVYILFALEETLDQEQAKANRLKSGDHRGRNSGYASLLSHKPFATIMIIYGLQQFQFSAFQGLFPLFCFSTTDHLGLSLPTSIIGTLGFLSATFSVCFNLLAFPIVHAKLGGKLMMRLCLWSYVVAGALFPILHFVRGTGMAQGEGEVGEPGLAVWILIVLQLIVQRFGDMCQPVLDVAIRGTLMDQNQLAVANGLVFIVASASRTFGPILFGALFSFSAAGPATSEFRRSLIWIILSLLGGGIGVGVCMPMHFGQEEPERVKRSAEDGYELMVNEGAEDVELGEIDPLVRRE